MRSDTTEPKSKEAMPPTLATLQAFLEVSSKLFISAAAVFYIAGILVVSAHLSQYGSFSVNLFRVNYVFAGVWAAIPPFLCAVSVSYGSVLANQVADRLLSEGSMFRRIFGNTADLIVHVIITRLAALWYTLISLLGFFCLLYLVGIAFPFSPSTVWLWIFAGAAYLVWGIRGNLKGVNARIIVTNAEGKVLSKEDADRLLGEDVVRRFEQERRSRLLGHAAYDVPICLVLTVLYLVGFGRFAYREIPAVLGGGAPQAVSIVMMAEDLEYLSVPSTSASNSTTQWSAMEPLAETDKEFLVAMGDDKLRVRRDLVHAMLLTSKSPEVKKKNNK